MLLIKKSLQDLGTCTMRILIGVLHHIFLAVNVAQGQMASQYADLNYNGFLWTANKSVDGDLRRDNPDTDRSCSANVGSGINNYWRVDLSQQYYVESIVIYGREGGG